MDIAKTGIPDGAGEQAPHTFNIGMRRDGGGDNDDALESMKQFMHPGGTAPTASGNSEAPVNLNPDIKAGEPSAAEFGMGRGPNGAI